MSPTRTTTTRSLLYLLKSHKAILRQLQWNLLILRVYLPTKRHFERQYNNSKSTRPSNDDTHTDIVKFPDYPWLCSLYTITSNVLLTWVVVKYLVPGLFQGLFHRWRDYISLSIINNYHCFMLGDFVIHYEQSDKLFGFYFATCHLLWRLTQHHLDRPYSLDVLLFLLQPKDDIRRFIAKLEAANESIERAIRRQRRLLPPYSSQVRPHLGGLSYWDQLSRQESLLLNIMCYQVILINDQFDERFHSQCSFKKPPIVLYKLRANRTLEARQRLINVMATITLQGFLILSVVVFVFAVYIGAVVIFNQARYYNNFPGCDAEFSKQFEAGQIKQWSLPPVSVHRVAAIIGDALENSLVWGESGIIALFALTFTGFLNQDLLFCWQHLEQKIQSYSRDIRQIYLVRHKLHSTQLTYSHHPFSEQIYELQAQLRDFFHQIQRVDLLVSDVITYALLIWLSGFGLISYRAAKVWKSSGSSEDIIVYVVVAVSAFVGYSVVSLGLLSLQRRCRCSHQAVCSMMAYDQSRYRKHFGELIMFYTDKNRACYTWFQQVPFSSANCFSVVGWSFTAFLVLDNVFNRR